MKQIVRYCLTALLILGGCTNETVLLPSSSSPSDTDTGGRTPLITRATACGFINAGQPAIALPPAPLWRTVWQQSSSQEMLLGFFVSVPTNTPTSIYRKISKTSSSFIHRHRREQVYGQPRREPTGLFTIPMRKLMWRIPLPSGPRNKCTERRRDKGNSAVANCSGGRPEYSGKICKIRLDDSQRHTCGKCFGPTNAYVELPTRVCLNSGKANGIYLVRSSSRGNRFQLSLSSKNLGNRQKSCNTNK